MLKGVPKCLSPDLLHALRSMGHGDEIVIADGNFPAASNAKRLIRADGLGVLEVLRAVVKYLPLDQYVMDNVCVMQGTRTRGEPATSIVVEMRQHEAHVACLRHTSRTWRYQLARSPADLERFRGTSMPSYARWTLELLPAPRDCNADELGLLLVAEYHQGRGRGLRGPDRDRATRLLRASALSVRRRRDLRDRHLRQHHPQEGASLALAHLSLSLSLSLSIMRD